MVPVEIAFSIIDRKVDNRGGRMPKILVIYDSRSGNTEKMALAVMEGVRAGKVDVEAKRAGEVTVKDMENADGLILGSPTHFGTMSDSMKKLIGDSVQIRKKMENKAGAAFTSAGMVGGGCETTLMSLIQAMLIYGMVVVGDPMAATGHYGAVAIKAPDEKALDSCKKLGERVAELVKKLA
jgi:NAD(P)H dehydrogenase (quinone)